MDKVFKNVLFESDFFQQAHIRIPIVLGSDVACMDMLYMHIFAEDEIHDERITELFRDAVQIAFDTDSINFSLYDHIVIFHAGIGQDFSLPFLDPTPEDIPSTFVDQEMLDQYVGGSIQFSNMKINQGIILPEPQNRFGTV